MAAVLTVNLSAPARSIARASSSFESAASRQRDGQLGGHATNSRKECGAMISRCGNVQNHEFVRALHVVAGRQRRRIAGVPQSDEVHAFYDTLAVRIEARNDAVRQAHPAVPNKIAQHLFAGPPDFSG